MSRSPQQRLAPEKHCRHACLAGIAWLAFGFGHARAASITETSPFTIQTPLAANLPAQTVTVSTPQFDPALGTFQSGTTVITGTTSIALEFFNTGAGGAYDVILTDTLTSGGIPGLFEQELTGILPPGQAAYITPPQNFAFGPVERSDPASLVVGTGTWSQLFSLPFPVLTVNQGPAAILPGGVINGSSVTTYTYVPAVTAVPEPKSVFVLVLSLALGFITRNRNIRHCRRSTV